MAEGEGNPYPYEGGFENDRIKHLAWERGRQHEEDNPSPQTIKKIQHKLTEKVKEMLIKELDFYPDEVLNIIDQLLQDGGD